MHWAPFSIHCIPWNTVFVGFDGKMDLGNFSNKDLKRSTGLAEKYWANACTGKGQNKVQARQLHRERKRDWDWERKKHWK